MTNPLFEVEHDGQTYAMTPSTLVDELIYSNYRHNRTISPEVTPQEWTSVFPRWEQLEARYQAELAHAS